MRRFLPAFWTNLSLNTLTLTCFMILGLLSFSVLHSGCTSTATSQASEPQAVPVASTTTTSPNQQPTPVVEESIQSDLVSSVPPADLLKLLPLAKTTPVFIDFTSEYCGECQAIAPVLAAAKKRYANKVTFLAIDVQKMMDAPEQTAGKALMLVFRPMYTPTLVAIKPGGIVVAVETGFKTSPQLDAMLNSALPVVVKQKVA